MGCVSLPEGKRFSFPQENVVFVTFLCKVKLQQNKRGGGGGMVVVLRILFGGFKDFWLAFLP